MPKLPVFVTNGEFFVWDAEVVMDLRQNHRIIGNCVGSLPYKPRQVIQGSLPMRLSKIEVAFLVGKSVIILKDASCVEIDNFTSDRKKEIEKARLTQSIAQKAVLQKQKSLELEAMSSTIMEGIEKKHNGTNGEQCHMTFAQFDVFKKSEVQRSASKLNEHLWLDMPISSISQSADDCPNVDCSINLSSKEKLMYDVFCDLYDQGFYMTNALKFGGDFLVYPGDPVAYHSFYIAICMPHDHKLSGLEYARYGRLANSVRKTLLLCSKNKDGYIEYLSVSWTGIAQSDERKC